MSARFDAPRVRLLEIVGNAIVGGMETYVQRLLERLPRDRFEVTVLCPWESRHSEALRQLGVEVLITPIPDEPCWSSITFAASLVRARGIDLIHCHLTNAHLLGALVGRLTDTPVLATVHGREVTIGDLEAHRLAGTQLCVVCRPAHFQALALGVDADRLHFVPNGADTEVFQPRRVRDGALRRRFGIPPQAPLVGFVGRLSWEKGPESFLRAALVAQRAQPQAHFVLVGDGPMQSQCAHFIEQYAMAGYAHLAGLQHDMPVVFAELDLVVSTSHSEAMPLALMEAMACGLPIVATRVGGVPDMVQHGLTGALVSPGDFDGVGAQIAKLLAQPDTLRTMGERARARAVAHFSLARSVEQTAELLARIAQGAAPLPLRAVAARARATGASALPPAADDARAPLERNRRGATARPTAGDKPAAA